MSGSVSLVYSWDSNDFIPDTQQKHGITKIEGFDESMVEHLLQKDQWSFSYSRLMHACTGASPSIKVCSYLLFTLSGHWTFGGDLFDSVRGKSTITDPAAEWCDINEW